MELIRSVHLCDVNFCLQTVWWPSATISQAKPSDKHTSTFTTCSHTILIFSLCCFLLNLFIFRQAWVGAVSKVDDEPGKMTWKKELSACSLLTSTPSLSLEQLLAWHIWCGLSRVAPPPPQRSCHHSPPCLSGSACWDDLPQAHLCWSLCLVFHPGDPCFPGTHILESLVAQNPRTRSRVHSVLPQEVFVGVVLTYGVAVLDSTVISNII